MTSGAVRQRHEYAIGSSVLADRSAAGQELRRVAQYRGSAVDASDIALEGAIQRHAMAVHAHGDGDGDRDGAQGRHGREPHLHLEVVGRRLRRDHLADGLHVEVAAVVGQHVRVAVDDAARSSTHRGGRDTGKRADVFQRCGVRAQDRRVVDLPHVDGHGGRRRARRTVVSRELELVGAEVVRGRRVDERGRRSG